MQLILRNIVLGTDAALSKSMSASADMATMSLNIKYAVIFITILPILMVYPDVYKRQVLVSWTHPEKRRYPARFQILW